MPFLGEKLESKIYKFLEIYIYKTRSYEARELRLKYKPYHLDTIWEYTSNKSKICIFYYPLTTHCENYFFMGKSKKILKL